MRYGSFLLVGAILIASQGCGESSHSSQTNKSIPDSKYVIVIQTQIRTHSTSDSIQYTRHYTDDYIVNDNFIEFTDKTTGKPVFTTLPYIGYER